MQVGIVALGLIGGSMARAYKEAEHTVWGWDLQSQVTGYAQLTGAIDGELTEDKLPLLDLLLLAATPDGVIDYLSGVIDKIAPGTMVMDICGTKRKVCDFAFPLAAKHGFTFVGGHPMAGTQYSGFKYSRSNLFKDASMIIVPPVFDDIVLLDRVKQLLSPLGFKKFIVTTPQHHDRMIAYTSQMCHVVSNAFVKSPAAQEHRGYSAGSFRDLTRVAKLNEKMWTELFLENRDNLLSELTLLIDHLQQYREALDKEDADTLCRLLREGRIDKEQSDI